MSSPEIIHPPWLYDYLVVGSPVIGTNLTKFKTGAPIHIDKIITPMLLPSTTAENKRSFGTMLATVNIVNNAIIKAMGGENDDL